MKANIFLILILCLYTQICVGQKGDLKLAWEENRPLTWKDFKGRADNSSPFSAMTSGSIMYKISNVSGREYRFIMEVGFVFKNSWVKSKKETDELLSHEQRHFDVLEIHARLFIKRLEESKVLGTKNFIEKVQKIYRKTMDDLNRMQELYDKETNHSKNTEKQKQWNEKINQMLEENKEFTKREILFQQ